MGISGTPPLPHLPHGSLTNNERTAHKLMHEHPAVVKDLLATGEVDVDVKD